MSPSGLVEAPQRIALVRLSALGDVTHILPLVHTLRSTWPEAAITWVIGRREAELVEGLEGVELVTLDKGAGLAGYRALGRVLRGRRFDLLLQLQTSFRAHLASLGVRAPVRLGWDRTRARDLHGLFINRRIPFVDRQHVLDGQFGFLEALGIRERVLDWRVPVPAAERTAAAETLPGHAPTLIISPGASNPLRNWPVACYCELADIATERHGLRVLLTGGPSTLERELADAICAGTRVAEPVDRVGKLTLKGLVAHMERATALVSPDSGPAHVAACARLPVIGLYAVSNPRRTGPYLSLEHTVDGYPEAARRYLGEEPEQLRWGTRVEDPRAMEAVTVEAAAERLAALVGDGVRAGISLRFSP
ncbi:heptosyltransferase I [Thiohalospira halophila DSM 15071]|uniref:Heptosyltransferase I n=1 Tax=Thiohalospira halophila DSM 15071 TaxID=1123397 RepID=A0A1I1SBM1_9GAMM|nr:glycosyltransferase family 9 protein [Thiohalospira halophila]SFD42008.1 heptosyltransferase I [Thiohalospira halophila DSM 15071]